MLLSENMRAIVILACEKHSAALVDKVQHSKEGNWFVLPPASLFKLGYWPNVAPAHIEGSNATALVGFMESGALAQKLREFEVENYDNGMCPDCAVYEWNVSSLHTQRTTRDPVCKRLISSSDSLSELFGGRLYFFCSMNCRDQFHKNPRNYVRSQAGE